MAANYATSVDWNQILRDRIKKMSPDGLYDTGMYDSVMGKRATGNQTGTTRATITATPPTEVTRQTTAGPSQSAQLSINPQLTPSSGSNSADGSAPGTAPITPSQQGTGDSQNTTAPNSGWKWGQGLTNTPFDYQSGNMDAYGDIAKMNVENLAADPAAQRRLWTQMMGGDVTTQQMLGNYMDPETALLLGGGNATSAVDQLKFSDALFDHATGRVGDGSGMYNSRDIMGTIVGALKAKPAGATNPGEATTIDHLGNQLGAGGDAFTQVNNVLNMMDQTLQFTMSERTYAAYKALIQREGQAFSDWRMTSEGSTANMSFGDWIESRLGPNAGL